ncbi:MAG: TraG family conjugative transposon ATPase [Paludibacteraceae bacterium]|nr:TraG family conjugative transposon ATPase [Paludibacteraceae bacterium]
MQMKAGAIEDCLPLLCWDNGCMISKFGDITVGYELSLPEVFSLGTEDYEQLHGTWVRALRTLPDETVVHKQDVFVRRLVGNEGGAPRSFLQQASDTHFDGRSFLDHRCWLFLTKSSKKTLQVNSLTSAICRARIVPESTLDESIQRDFLDAAGRFVKILSDQGISLHRLTADEWVGTPECAGLAEQYISLDYSDKICLQDLHIEGKDLMVGDRYVSVFALSELDDLPNVVRNYERHPKLSADNTCLPVGSAFPLCMDLPFPHIYNQYFFLDDHKETLARIEKRGREQESLSRISRENAVNKAFNDQYLNEAVMYGRRSVRCAVNVLVWDENYARLLRKNSRLGACLAHLDCTAHKVEYVVPQVFWAGIPGAAAQYPSDMTFLTFLEQACCWINLESVPQSHTNGGGVRLCDRIFGVPLQIDLSDYPREKGWIDNRNKFILGPSGSGKSFFTNHILRQYYEQGAHIVIVDVGDSYQGLCRMINEESHGQDGIYYTYTEEHPIAFNPFYAKTAEYSIEKKEQLASLVFCLWKNENELVTKAEETHIATALNGYLKLVSEGHEKAGFTEFYNYLDGPFRKQLETMAVRRENFDVDNLLQVLRPYSKGGMYDYLLNAETNVDLNGNRLIVFEIDNIKDHKTLFPVVTLILMDTFITKMRHPALAGQRKMILLEEAWKAISKSGTAEFIKYLYKTVRKHFGEAIVVTQDIEDLVGNDIVKNAIIANADCKILLDQRKYASRFDEIQQVLALSEKEKSLALSVNRDLKTTGRPPYKEVFVSLNGNHTAVYGVEVSPEEYLCYTTEKKEKAKVLEAAESAGSMSAGIIQYLNQQKVS